MIINSIIFRLVEALSYYIRILRRIFVIVGYTTLLLRNSLGGRALACTWFLVLTMLLYMPSNFVFAQKDSTAKKTQDSTAKKTPNKSTKKSNKTKSKTPNKNKDKPTNSKADKDADKDDSDNTPKSKTKSGTAITDHFYQIEQKNSDDLLKLLKNKPEYFERVLKDPDKFRLQIIYTKVLRDKQGKPHLKHYTLYLDTLEYFFPASMVKLPAAILSLEKINTLNIDGLTPFTQMVVKKGYSCQTANGPSEACKKDGYPSLRGYIKDALVVSGNISYDRMYEFIGQQKFNEELWARGYTSAQICQRYGHYCTNKENSITNPIEFRNKDSVLYSQPQITNTHEYRKNLKGIFVGKGKQLADGTIRFEPRDFSTSNSISLKDLHLMLISVIMPNVIPLDHRFKLKKRDYELLRAYMSMYPNESPEANWDMNYYTATRMKYLVYGGKGNKPDPNVRIFNKVGLALGFLTDCAYIVDFDKKVEFFLSATIYVNANEIIGDGNYEFYTVGLPFLQHLGEVLLEYERGRKRKFYPDLEKYRFDYSKY